MIDIDSDFKQNLSNKYLCNLCNYNTCRKSNIINHINSKKHKQHNTTILLKQNTLLINDSCCINNALNSNHNETNVLLSTHKYTCICGKIYKYDSGYYRHKKTCNLSVIQSGSIKDFTITSQMFMEVIKQNAEFKELLIEQHKTILELSKEKTITNTNCNNTNNKFNLNLFLNETCKDAMNMSDFLNQLQLTTKDLDITGQDGFAVGIGHSFVQGIKALEAHKRPLHCSDLKRETFYIKEDNVWEKEDETRGKLTKAIQKIAHKNILNIPAWKAEHPHCRDQHHKDNDKFLQIMIESMTGKDDPNIMQEYDKIIRNVAKEVFIDKS